MFRHLGGRSTHSSLPEVGLAAAKQHVQEPAPNTDRRRANLANRPIGRRRVSVHQRTKRGDARVAAMPYLNRPAVNHCCAVIVLNLVARDQLPDGSWSDLCARFVESLKQTFFSGSTQCSLKRKRIAISRDSILRSPFSCVLTKLTQPPVNSLSHGRRTHCIGEYHRPSVYY